MLNAQYPSEGNVPPLRFKNFSIWRGRLPHWRADDVTYYVTFRHSRELDAEERAWLFRALLRAEGRQFKFQILCVLPETTEMLFQVQEGTGGRPHELAKIVEAAKRHAGKRVTKSTGERYPPFWSESYDRIVRDEAEFEERWLDILESPVKSELADDPEDYENLWVAAIDRAVGSSGSSTS